MADFIDYPTVNFNNAIEIIEQLTKYNSELLEKIEKLELKLSKPEIKPEIKLSEEIRDLQIAMMSYGSERAMDEFISNKIVSITNEADKAMKQYTAKLRKEIDNAKSKQSKGK